MKPVVLTNDDGIGSPGLHALAVALADVCDLTVIAPMDNQSAVSHSITLLRDLHVREHEIPAVKQAFAVDGTPADCVRLATLGLAGEQPALIVSGANLGLNLGDDLAYSGTASAAIEAALNDIPGIAVSQQTTDRELGFPRGGEYDFTLAQAFVAGLVDMLLGNGSVDLLAAMQGDEEPASDRSGAEIAHSAAVMLNVNVPGIPIADARGVRLTQPCRRYYRDSISYEEVAPGVRRYSITGHEPSHCDRPDTDAVAVRDGYVSVTPVKQRFDDELLRSRLGALRGLDWMLPDGLSSG